MPISDEMKKSFNVLIVDDDQVSLRLTEGHLRSIGFVNVTAVEDGKKALRKIELTKIDLIICDLYMPELSGVDLLKEVRSFERYREVPFIMLTGETAKDKVLGVVKAGVTDYVIKPVTKSVLEAKLDGIFQRLGITAASAAAK